MNALEYVKQNWQTLPKSAFNGEEVVIVHTQENEDWGDGHHSYSGYGVDAEGRLYLCFSSGCSCNGSCGRDHVEELKKLEIHPTDFPNFNSPELIDFAEQQVEFSDY